MVEPNETEFKQKISIIRDQFEVCTPYLTTLSDPVRQKILLILAESGTDGMDVQDITAKISLSRPAISHHLKILKDAGMIISHKKGTQVYYFIYIYKALDKIEAVISHNEASLETWLPLEYELNRTYGFDAAAFSPCLTALRQAVLRETEEKIAAN